MTKDQVNAVLARVPTWPEDRQQELAEVATARADCRLGRDCFSPLAMTSFGRSIGRSRQATKQSRAAASTAKQCIMTEDRVNAVLARVPTWPEDRQQELAEVALEIAAELAGAGYDVTLDELAAIDEGLSGEAASEEEVTAAFALFRKA